MTSSARLRLEAGKDRLAGQVGDLDGSQVVLIPCGDGELVAQHTLADVRNHGSGVIHQHGGGQVSTIAQLAVFDQRLHILRRQGAVLIDIILGDRHDAHTDVLTLGDAQLLDGLVDADAGAEIAPGGAGDMVVGAVDIPGGRGIVHGQQHTTFSRDCQ